MSRKELIRRYALFVVGLFLGAMGIAFGKHSGLGVSPISSVANVFSCQYTAVSLGVWVIIWNCVLVVSQIIVLRRKFKPFQLLQIPLAFLFGWFTDLGVWILSPIPMVNYAAQLATVICGIIVLGFGVAITVVADVMLNSGEAFVKAVADTTHRDFGHTKIVFDVICVCISVVLSLCFFDFTIVGTREGTVITALLTGIVVNFFTKRLQGPLTRFCTRGTGKTNCFAGPDTRSKDCTVPH